jgi:protein SCO1/2
MRRVRHTWHAVVALALAAAAIACTQKPKPREFEIVGQIVRIDRNTHYATIRHDDIVGFMPAMTMPFAVKPSNLLEGREPGDLVRGTLLVDGAEAWIGALTKTGHAPLPPAETTAGLGLVVGDRLPDTTFVDHLNQPLGLDWLDAHTSVITFVYTRCPLPDFCPAIDSRFRALQDEIGKAPAGSALASVRLLSITIDPAFDTPAVLAAHATRLNARPAIWRFATATPETIAAFGQRFGLDVRQTGAGAADIEHNLRTIILDRDRRIVEMLTGAQWSASDLVAKVRAAAGA